MPTICCDNMGPTYLSAKRILHAHTNHVEIQVAEVLPKPLFTFSFTFLGSSFRLNPHPQLQGRILVYYVL